MAVAPKLSALGRTIAAVGDAAVEARERPPLEERLAAIHADLAMRGEARAGESLRGPVALGMALGAAAAALLLFPWREPALTFAVGEPTVAGQEGAWLVAPPAQELPVGFSDGSRLRLAGGARARVFDLGAHGAQVGIERGSLRIDVVPRPGNTWAVVGGPFEIRVTGTSFDAGWDPDREQLRVQMREGHVLVRAACLDHPRALSAGDAVTLSCAGAGHAASSPPPAAAPVSAAPRSTGAPPPRPAVSAAPTEPPPLDTAAPVESPPADWRALGRAGDTKGALAAAEGEGWATLCNTVSAADLLELGTLARLAGARARAVEAYTALRARFAGGDAAATAAFHLGQLAFDGAHAYAEAHGWFAAYLAERPSGALAGEALGRSMEAEQRLGDLTAARETARLYLARYPTGAHAGLAGSLVAP